MRLILLLLAMTAGAAHSCDSINIGLRSYHWDRLSVHKEQPQNKDKGLTEKHVAIGCTNIYGRWDALYFKNSKNRDTLYVGDYWKWKKYGRWRLGADYGIFIHGYSDRVPAVPALLPKIRWESRRFVFNFYVLWTQGVAAGLEFPL